MRDKEKLVHVCQETRAKRIYVKRFFFFLFLAVMRDHIKNKKHTHSYIYNGEKEVEERDSC